MGAYNFPLPALNIKPIPQADPLEAMTRGMQLRQAMALQPLQLATAAMQYQQQRYNWQATQAINQAFAQSYKLDENGVPQFDEPGLMRAINLSGYGAQGAAVAKEVTAWQEQLQNLAKTKNELRTQELDAIGQAGYAINKGGNDPNLAIHMLQSIQGMYPTVGQYIQGIQQNPGSVPALTQQMMSMSPKIQNLLVEQYKAKAAGIKTAGGALYAPVTPPWETAAPTGGAPGAGAAAGAAAAPGAGAAPTAGGGLQPIGGAPQVTVPPDMASAYGVPPGTQVTPEVLQHMGAAMQSGRDARYQNIIAKQAAGQPITQEEANFAAGYKAQKLLVPTTVANIRLQGMQESRIQPVLNTANNNALEFRNVEEINAMNAARPGTYVPAGPGTKALSREAVFADLHNSIELARTSIANLEDMDAPTRAQLAFALKSTDPHSAVSSFLSSTAGLALTPKQQDAVIALNNLAENAMAIRGVAGIGASAGDVRAAIANTIPSGKTPTRGYALQQLDTMERMVNNLEQAVPKVGQGLKPAPKTGAAAFPPDMMDTLKANAAKGHSTTFNVPGQGQQTWTLIDGYPYRIK